MKYCFIINPASGKAATKEGLEEKIISACQEKGIQPTIIVSKSADDLQSRLTDFYSSMAGEAARIYACGGDGTLSMVVNSIMQLEDRSNISVGVIPVGTGNDYVRNFTPKELFFDVGAQLDATSYDVDLIKCNDTYAINMINIGFDSHVVCNMVRFRRSKLVPSKFAYILGLVMTLVKKPGVGITISDESGVETHKDLMLMTFANGRYCGGGFNSNPNAYINNGKLNALFVKTISRIQFIMLVKYYKNGTHICEKFHKILNEERADFYDIKFDDTTPVSIDGEISFLKKAKISAVKRAIKFLVPHSMSGLEALAKDSEFAEA